MRELISTKVPRIGGIFLVGVFALNVYIGLYDTNLRNLQPIHWEINWVLAAANLVAGILLLGFPRKTFAVVLGGVVWPIVYVCSLAIDVYTRLCIGGNQDNCWPSKTAAFQYLILNEPKQGWQLWQGTVPVILALTFLAFVLSVITAYQLRASRVSGSVQPSMTPSSPSTEPKSGPN